MEYPKVNGESSDQLSHVLVEFSSNVTLLLIPRRQQAPSEFPQLLLNRLVLANFLK